MGDNLEGGENCRDSEMSPALISVHPLHKSICVAVGSDLRVFDLQEDCSVSLVDNSGGPIHKDSIRSICFGAKGSLFVSAGDDKLVKIWSTGSWSCVRTVLSEKRVSAVTISKDGRFVCFADKFGVVWLVDMDHSNEYMALANDSVTPILAHYCSIITCLEFSPDGCFLVSADRDCKIRVTIFPSNPLDGAHEIQTFCLGHTEYISCLTFICSMNYPKAFFVVSGGGDSFVRLWDPLSGSLLDACNVAAETELVQSNGKKDDCCSAVMDLCITGSTIIAVSIQSLHGVMLLNCDLSAKRLSFIKAVLIPGEAFIPTSLGFCGSSELLWMVTGVANICDLGSLARVKVLSGLKNSCACFVGDEEIPGGGKLLEKLQGSVCFEEEVLLESTEAVRTAMHNLLSKKKYSVETREFRKRSRNDKRNKHNF